MGKRKLRHLIGQVKPSPLITKSYKLGIIYILEGIVGQCPSVKDLFFFFLMVEQHFIQVKSFF